MDKLNHNGFSLEKLVFSSNLKEFSQRVNHICLLLAHGEMTSEEAEQEIDGLYQQLQTSAATLGIKKLEF